MNRKILLKNTLKTIGFLVFIFIFQLFFFVLFSKIGFATMGWTPNCSTTGSNYIVADSFDDTNGVRLDAHNMDFNAGATSGWNLATGNVTISGNKANYPASGSTNSFTFTNNSDTANNITVEYVSMKSTSSYWGTELGFKNAAGTVICKEGQTGCTDYGDNCVELVGATTVTDNSAGSTTVWHKIRITYSDVDDRCWVYLIDNNGGILYKTNVASVAGTGSAVQIYNLHNGGVSDFFDNLTAYKGDTCPTTAPPPSIPTISSKNITSETPNILNIVSGTPVGPLTDTTPTIVFMTDINANCSIANKQLSYDNMLVSGSVCSSGENTTGTHTCTLSNGNKLQYANDAFFLSCANSGSPGNNFTAAQAVNVNVTIPQGTWNLSLSANQTATIQNQTTLFTAKAGCLGLINCTYTIELDPEAEQDFIMRLAKENAELKQKVEKIEQEKQESRQSYKLGLLSLGIFTGVLIIILIIVLTFRKPKNPEIKQEDNQFDKYWNSDEKETT